MLIDAGGARMRQRTEPRVPGYAPRVPGYVPPDVMKPPSPFPITVSVHVTETHDGEACDCIEKDMTLEVGDEVELVHTCHDGRVDKVVARVTAINLPVVEHGSAGMRRVDADPNGL